MHHHIKGTKMLVKIPDAPDELVSRIKLATGMATASKAFMAAAQGHDSLKRQIIDQQAEIDSLRQRLEHANSLIASARSAAASLLGNVEPGRKRVASLKDVVDDFDSQTALDLEQKKFDEGDLPGMPYV
jgi:predicted  nucleic acid-binding Zn-ribbon protein